MVILESTIFRNDGVVQDAYPPPATGEPSAPQNIIIYLPLITELFPPPAAPSYYINFNNILAFYDLGYALGVHDRDTPGTQDNLVILDYGYPAIDNNGIYGAKLSFR
jgi:hypothetical protein